MSNEKLYSLYDYDQAMLLSKRNLSHRSHDEYDVVVIIPVYRRTEFNHTVTSHFLKAERASGMKIAVVIVEHSDANEHGWMCYQWVNHIFIPNQGRPFNKCLAHNIGILHFPNSKNYLFHDVDIIVPPDFFLKAFENMRGNDAIQTFSKKRLFQANEFMTGKIMVAGEDFFGTVPWSSRHVKENEPGAVGGSIMVSRELLLKVGGFDPELFTEYSIEDQFFFDKLNLLGKFGYADDPAIDLLHLYHPPSFNRITKQEDWDTLDAWQKMSHEEKVALCALKSNHFKQFVCA